MALEGGCYCGALRYEVTGDPMFKGQCHCRECQYISGGHPNVILGVPGPGFRYTKGAPKEFQRSDLESPVSREFCAECGTHILARPPAMGGAVVLKAGTLDDPAEVGTLQMAIYLCDKQPFHHVPEGIPTFERTPQG
jgi:hypothetical protein